MAAALQIEPDRVNIKATTEEGLGFTGVGEGISAQAVCALVSLLDKVADDRMAGGCGNCRGGCGRKDEGQC